MGYVIGLGLLFSTLFFGCGEITKNSSTLSEAREESQPLVDQALWSERVPFATVKSYLPQLKAKGIDLYLAITPDRFHDQELYDLLRAANHEGVNVNAWMLMAGADGFWANKWNAAKLAQNVRDLLAALDAEGLKVAWITIDMEPTMEIMLKIRQRAQKFDIKGLMALFRELAESTPLSEAKKIYSDLVKEMHARDVKVHVVTIPFVLDDFVVGHEKIANVLGTPIKGIAWDKVSFMVYRPFYEEMLGKVSSSLIYSYARDAQQHFGAAAGVDLGPVGPQGGTSDPLGGGVYATVALMHADVAAARAAGVDKIHLFALDGMHQLGGLGEWFTVPEPKKPGFNLKVSTMRKSAQVLSRTLPEPE